MTELNITHAELVTALAKSPESILQEATAKDLGLIHMILGVSGEAGELLDAVKKHVIYHKELDRKNIIEELGDIEFYLEGFRQELKITREETLVENIKKLSERYRGLKYSDENAIERADKKEECLPDAFEQGKIAFLAGIPKTDNPYTEDTDARYAWSDGWYYEAIESRKTGDK